MPVPDGMRIPTRSPSPSPETASKTSSSASVSRRKIDDAFAPKIARATFTIDCSKARWLSSDGSMPVATASR